MPRVSAGAGRGLHGDDPDLLAGQLVAHEGQGDAAEVAAAAGAADHDIRVGSGHVQLIQGLQPDHRLVQQHVVEHAAQRVLGVLAGGGVLHGLADRDAQAAQRVGVLGSDAPANGGILAGTGHHAGAPGLHHRAAIRLLLVADPHHVDLALQPEHLAGEGHRAAPLPGAGLGGDPVAARRLVVIGLGHGRVGLMAPGGTDALVLVEDACGGIQGALQPVRAVQRGGPPEPVGGAHLLGDGDEALGADLLPDQGHGEQRRQVAGPDRLRRCRDAGAAAAGWAGRPRCCTRLPASGTRPACTWFARPCKSLLPNCAMSEYEAHSSTGADRPPSYLPPIVASAGSFRGTSSRRWLGWA